MKKGLVWIRRDIRLHDHAALSAATKECDEVYLVFVFDKKILDKLEPEDRRVSFLYESLWEIEEKVGIHTLIGDPVDLIPKLYKKLKIDQLYFNRDYEPYALKRDNKVIRELKEVATFKDSVFFEPHEILKSDGTPYTVFTPYKRKWLEAFLNQGKTVSDYKVNLKKIKNGNSKLGPALLKKMGFEKTKNILVGGTSKGKKLLSSFDKKIEKYDETRDFPAMEGTSNLSVYIRFGCISIRDMIRLSLKKDSKGHDVWLSELIWREFYQMILGQFPHVVKKEFKPKYEGIPWSGTSKEFKAWKEGKTGFPIVDAAMRCLNETGMMPNRLRMVVASFLCKTLLIDWKKGEKYFASKLLDFDLASNNGGWQWSSSTGCDAQPYFRIFNPYSQSQKFDGDGEFIKKWCPELASLDSKKIHQPDLADMLELAEAGCSLGKDYPFPVVSYSRNRQKALQMYKKALS